MLLKIVAVFLAAALMPAGASSGQAASTGWMSNSQLNSYARANLTGKAYGTSIDCKDSPHGPLLNIGLKAFPSGYKALSGIALFHRWYWVVASSPELSSKIARKKRDTKPHLKWRIVQQKSFVDSKGRTFTCALLYR